MSGTPGLGRECRGQYFRSGELSQVSKKRDLLSVTRLPGIPLFSQSIENTFWFSNTMVQNIYWHLILICILTAGTLLLQEAAIFYRAQVGDWRDCSLLTSHYTARIAMTVILSRPHEKRVPEATLWSNLFQLPAGTKAIITDGKGLGFNRYLVWYSTGCIKPINSQ